MTWKTSRGVWLFAVAIAKYHEKKFLCLVSQKSIFSRWPHVKNRTFILAGGHVRASAGALAVHTALIPCVCVCVCLSVRYQTPFSSRHESVPSLFLSTGKHPVGGQLPRVFFSALPGQSSDRPNLPPHKKLSIFQFPFASIRRATSQACSGLGKRRIDRSTSKRSSKKLQRATITAFFLDRSLVVVHCDRS